MDKKYLLTVEFICRVNDQLKGTGDFQAMEKTRQFLQALAADDATLLEIYKLTLFNQYIVNLEDHEVFAEKLKVRDFGDIFIPVMGKVSPEVAGYIEQLYCTGEPRDSAAFSEWDRKKEVLEEQFGLLRVGGATFVEIKK